MKNTNQRNSNEAAQATAEVSRLLETVRAEVAKIIVGQRTLVDRLLMALMSNGHVLVEGVPGLAKTMTVQTLSRALGLGFQRISFTPDLLPADVIGTMVYNPKDGTFVPHKGPIFTNLLLADEINRAPPKVQSALLEAMQERRVTLGTSTYPLPQPFFVMATQNPIEQEGTYPLPEAQVDRFMLKCSITYPTREEERAIMERFGRHFDAEVRPALSGPQILALRASLDSVYCDEKLCEYILDIVAATRDPGRFGLNLRHAVEYGASPRATLCLNIAARANALLRGRGYATPQDVKDVAHDVLRHRIILSYEAEAEELTADRVIREILAAVPVP